MYDNLYHLHIPKTGGIWLNSHVLDELRPSLDRASVPMRYDHGTWTDVKDSTYVVSILRDPAERLASHFAYSVKHFGPEHADKQFNDRYRHLRPTTWRTEEIKEVTVDNFMWWVKDKEQYLSNYQSKFITYDKLNPMNGPLYLGDEGFTNLIVDRDLLDTNLKRVNLLIKNTQLTSQNIFVFREKILNDLGLPYIALAEPPLFKDSNTNSDSTRLWNELSTSQKDYLYSLNKIDSEIWNTDSYYWNDGK